MSAPAAAPAPAPARRDPFPPNWPARAAWGGLALYALYAASTLEVTWERFVYGLGNGARFIGRMLPPDFSKTELLLRGLIESLEIAVIASAVGILLAMPVGLMAARNLMPRWLSWPARGLIALCRSFHAVIVAILFVKAVGFGALAGILALVVSSIGFIAKLIAEAIEEISLKPIEAMRAAGASFGGVVAMAVVPQVLDRFVGFATYQLDSNLRNSTMVGIVGGGGIGATLFTAFQKFDYDFVLAILIAIIGVIFAGELLAGWIRDTFK
ncbi:MAG: phosphonate ABC transporter, permease protein PhnE [Alphaproteobacteria bacterium]|nr:phosphonate ABC transporter, permease protein PhnE [Alphaproteobacteria bacterium]